MVAVVAVVLAAAVAVILTATFIALSKIRLHNISSDSMTCLTISLNFRNHIRSLAFHLLIIYDSDVT